MMWVVGGETTEVAGASRPAVVAASGKSFMPSMEWRTLAGRLLPMVLASEGEPMAEPPFSWVAPMVDMLCLWRCLLMLFQPFEGWCSGPAV